MNHATFDIQLFIISLHIRSMWETTVMHKQVSGWTVNFGPNFPESPPPPISENFRFEMTKVYSGIPPSPFRKTSDLGWPKFTPEYPPPPISENFRFGMTKVYSRIPPTPLFGKLQIWDDHSLLWNTPPPNENCQRVQVRDFQNTESYYMWRLYPTRIITSFLNCAFRLVKRYEGSLCLCLKRSLLLKLARDH